jgi:hypothetical protein
LAAILQKGWAVGSPEGMQLNWLAGQIDGSPQIAQAFDHSARLVFHYLRRLAISTNNDCCDIRKRHSEFGEP